MRRGIGVATLFEALGASLLVFGIVSSMRPQPPAAASNSALLNQLKAARKAAVGQPLTINNQQVCGPAGDSSDPKMQELDTNKNRTDEPPDASVVTADWTAVNALPQASAPEIVGAPIRVVGYLSHRINVESSGKGESTNCHLTQPNEVDWHMYLTPQPNLGIARAMIVETTPRVRPNHKWTTQLLQPYVNKMTRVRVTGWLLFDSEHLDVVGKERASVWEVHPVTKFEIEKSPGQWTNVEQ